MMGRREIMGGRVLMWTDYQLIELDSPWRTQQSRWYEDSACTPRANQGCLKGESHRCDTVTRVNV